MKERDSDNLCLPALGHEIDGGAAGLISVVGNKNLIALAERQRAHDGVHARSGVLDQGQIVRVARQHLGERMAGNRHLFEPFSVKKSHGLVFHTVLPVPLFFTNHVGRGAEGAVIKEHR